MMNRDRISLWARVFAIGMAAVFVISSVFIGFTAAGSYNLIQVLGGGSAGGGGQTTVSTEDRIQSAEQQLEQNPEDPQAITNLGLLYMRNDQSGKAVEVLERGREVAPEDPNILLSLAQAYSTQAQNASGDEQKKLYKKAGDTYASYFEIAEQPDPNTYLFAGQAYENAGEPGLAIKYYNKYLDERPDGQAADQVKQRISRLLEGGETTGGNSGG
jgi:cytochrome c-type biogenesis protein CcmH/NrfG